AGRARIRSVTKPRNPVCCALLLAVALAVAGSASAEGEGSSVPAVSLERLFQLPPQAAPKAAEGRQRGADREEWEERFRSAHGEVDAADAELRAVQEELESLAAGSAAWQLAAPGASAGSKNSPLSFRLRQEIRRQRENLAKVHVKLTELRVEASLAGVPQEWQGDQSPSSQDRLKGRKKKAGSANSAVDAK
ncbi:MAG: hypothetical protein VCB99_11315, partial [Myxococcota bacterium]